MRKVCVIFAAAAGAVFLLSGSAAFATNGSTVFAGLYFSPTNGKVGYHMVAHNYWTKDPCNTPAEHIIMSDYTVVGTVPPGLQSPGMATGLFNFEGTPRQAGDWEVKVTAHDVTCAPAGTATRGVNYGDFVTTVKFHIDP
ncbi:MAG TPA: hypothetical protein VGL66_11170 [Caulobacteraceae bacterium]|jgi:hypothetical protein